MGVEVQVGGADKLRRLAADIRRAGRVDLPREIAKGIRKATSMLPAAIKREVASGSQIPSGFRATLAPAVRASTSVLAQQGTRSGVRVRVYASGRREHRDIAAMDKGILRHPVYGRRKTWVAQRIGSGVVDAPAKRTQSEVVTRVEGVLDEIADRLAKGV